MKSNTQNAKIGKLLQKKLLVLGIDVGSETLSHQETFDYRGRVFETIQI